MTRWPFLLDTVIGKVVTGFFLLLLLLLAPPLVLLPTARGPATKTPLVARSGFAAAGEDDICV
jgi:hypothetical protein